MQRVTVSLNFEMCVWIASKSFTIDLAQYQLAKSAYGYAVSSGNIIMAWIHETNDWEHS